MESGKEQNYWPGFVDALSNVVLVLVFVLVVFVFALLITSSKVDRKAKEMVKAAHERVEKEEVQQNVSQLKRDVEKYKAEAEALRKKLDIKDGREKAVPLPIELKEEPEISGKSAFVVVGRVQIVSQDNKVIIVYPKAVSDLDEVSMVELDRVLSNKKKELQEKQIHILSVIGIESYTAARRLSYYRVLELRNHLLQKYAVKGQNIKNNIVQPEEPGNGRVEIIFE